jgi:hypothetical protein
VVTRTSVGVFGRLEPTPRPTGRGARHETVPRRRAHTQEDRFARGWLPEPASNYPAGLSIGRAAARRRTSSSITVAMVSTTRHDCARSGSSWSVTARNLVEIAARHADELVDLGDEHGAYCWVWHWNHPPVSGPGVFTHRRGTLVVVGGPDRCGPLRRFVQPLRTLPRAPRHGPHRAPDDLRRSHRSQRPGRADVLRWPGSQARACASATTGPRRLARRRGERLRVATARLATPPGEPFDTRWITWD